MYDPKCEELARYFLGDLASEPLVAELAQTIQSAAGDCLEEQREELERRNVQTHQ